MKRKHLTPKQRVLKKYPKAFCETNGDLGYQVVALRPFAVAKVLGINAWSRRGAWAAAADNMRRSR